MTDIRPTLRNRLMSIDAELANIDSRRARLSGLREALVTTLEQENALQGGNDNGQTELVLHPTGRGSLSDKILDALANGPKTLDELKGLAGDWFPPDYNKSIGRALNFALVGLAKGDHVERLESGAWKSAKSGRK